MRRLRPPAHELTSSAPFPVIGCDQLQKSDWNCHFLNKQHFVRCSLLPGEETNYFMLYNQNKFNISLKEPIKCMLQKKCIQALL